MQQKIKMKKQKNNDPTQQPTLSKAFWIGAQVKYDVERWKELRELSVKPSRVLVNRLIKT